MRISDWSSDVCSSDLEDALKVLQRHVQQQANARRQRLQEPDMRDRGRKLDMPHPLAADLGNRDLDTAFFADDALVFHALRSEEHTSELQSLMRISYAVFCLKKKKNKIQMNN